MGLFENKKVKKQSSAEHVPGKNDADNAKKAELKQAKAAERKAAKEAKRREAKFAAAKKKAARDARKEREAEERKRKEAQKAEHKAEEKAKLEAQKAAETARKIAEEAEKIAKAEERQRASDKRALSILNEMLKENPLKYEENRMGLLGFRRLSFEWYNPPGYDNKCTVSAIQLIMRNASRIVILHGNKKETIDSLRKSLSYRLEYYCSFIKMPDQNNEIARALGFILPSFDSVTVNCDTTVLPDPKKVYLSRIATPDQAVMLSDCAFETMLSTYRNWAENNGTIAALGISRDLYNDTVTRYSQIIEMMGVEKQRRESERLAQEAEETERTGTLKNSDSSDDQEQQIIEAGKQGEKEVNYALRFLWKGPNYALVTPTGDWDEDGLTRVKLQISAFLDEPQEYDQVLVGSQGVFVIETKNLSGEIQINEFGKWTRKKKNETEFRTLENNPAAQLMRHRKVMEAILQDAYPQVNVICIICISNKNAEINGEENCKYPVVIADAIADYIEDYKSDTQLSKEEMEAVAEHIKSFIVE